MFSVFSSRLVQVGDAAAAGAAGPGTVRVPFDRHSLTVPHSTTARFGAVCVNRRVLVRKSRPLCVTLRDDRPPATHRVAP